MIQFAVYIWICPVSAVRRHCPSMPAGCRKWRIGCKRPLTVLSVKRLHSPWSATRWAVRLSAKYWRANLASGRYGIDRAGRGPAACRPACGRTCGCTAQSQADALLAAGTGVRFHYHGRQPVIRRVATLPTVHPARRGVVRPCGMRTTWISAIGWPIIPRKCSAHMRSGAHRHRQARPDRRIRRSASPVAALSQRHLRDAGTMPVTTRTSTNPKPSSRSCANGWLIWRSLR